MGEERKRIGDAHIERLKSGLGEAGLQKVEKRVHMYEFSGPPRVVAAEGAETRSKEGRSAR
jgi:hypothetical protein